MLSCFASCLILIIFPRGVKICLWISRVQQIRAHVFVLAVVLVVSMPQATWEQFQRQKPLQLSYLTPLIFIILQMITKTEGSVHCRPYA